MTKELSTVVKICQEGKLKLKKKSEIAPGWPIAGGGLKFYSFLILNKLICRMCLVRRYYL